MSILRTFATDILAFDEQDTINTVADAFLSQAYQQCLSVAVVNAKQQPVGMISRHQLNDIFLKKFGRELFGNRPVKDFMRQDVLSVEVTDSLAEAAAYISKKMRFPLSEDFVITEQGRYLGMGAVLHLLSAMEKQISQSAAELNIAYRQLSSSQAQLVQSEKMAALGQMVAGVAHEINTPLGYVNNNIEMAREFFAQFHYVLQAHEHLAHTLIDPNSRDVDIAESLANLDDAKAGFDSQQWFADLEGLFADTFYGVEQISELVTGLKNFSRLDQAILDNVSLNECIENALLIARNTLKYKVTVLKRLEDVPPIRCAASQINQVLLNLFTNAAQAIKEQGYLLIKSWSDKDFVYVSVQDTGCGIAAEHLAKIFDPFFTTKPVGQGTGLGLSISYKIIQQHQGSIRVASELGKGTRFVIAFPRTLNLSAAA
ncbi:ATP-binding protein [Agitococcus lubricus]|uniref:histidine kinase n=1 Tax=Agitococcus lubricus TaxID=1077255 RepID=A0A2T5J1C1_9GAMM|nr:ATP-binding protein [Agitococcus lubricus]PTQ90180.1 CBS domain protein [Agitococcus lubricus]